MSQQIKKIKKHKKHKKIKIKIQTPKFSTVVYVLLIIFNKLTFVDQGGITLHFPEYISWLIACNSVNSSFCHSKSNSNSTSCDSWPNQFEFQFMNWKGADYFIQHCTLTKHAILSQNLSHTLKNILAYEISKITKREKKKRTETAWKEKISRATSWNSSASCLHYSWVISYSFHTMMLLSLTSIASDLWFYKESVRFLHRAAAHIQSICEHVSKRWRERISEHVENSWRGERSQCLANNKK